MGRATGTGAGSAIITAAMKNRKFTITDNETGERWKISDASLWVAYIIVFALGVLTGYLLGEMLGVIITHLIK